MDRDGADVPSIVRDAAGALIGAVVLGAPRAVVGLRVVCVAKELEVPLVEPVEGEVDVPGSVHAWLVLRRDLRRLSSQLRSLAVECAWCLGCGRDGLHPGWCI